MKLNKKFLGMFLTLGMMFSLISVSAENLKNGVVNNVAIEFVIDGKNMQKRKEGSKNGPDRYVENEKNKTTEKEGVFLYIVLKEAFGKNGLWNDDIKKKLIDEIFLNKDGIKLTTEISFYDLNVEVVEKLKDAVKKTNFKDIKITEDMLKKAIKDMKDVRGKNVEDAIDEVRESKEYLKGGDKALRKGFINRIKKDIKEQEILLEKLEGEELKEGKKKLENLNNNLKKAKKEINKKVSKETKEAEKQFIRNGEGFIEDNKRKLEDVEKVKFKDIKNLSKDLVVSKTLIDLKTGKRI